MVTAKELRHALEHVPDDAQIVLDTSVVMGNYEKSLECSIIIVSNEGSLLTLVSVPDKDVPECGSDSLYWSEPLDRFVAAS